MSLHDWLQNLRSALAPGRGRRLPRRRGSSRAATHRPNLEVLEDRALPSFSAPIDYAVGANAHAVVTADFNGDGHLDLAAANYDSIAAYGNVSVLLGNGDGTFQPARNYNNGSAPASIVVGDFNGDGKLDLVTGDLVDDDFGRITVLLGNGDGTFQEGGREAAFGQNTTMALAVGDFNADGKLDVAAIGHSTNSFFNEVDVLLGRGDGTFAPQSSYYSPSTDGDSSLATGDFNRDGKVDLAWPDIGGSAVDVLLGNGDGTFAAAAQSFATDPYPSFVALADLNGDGKIDLVTANPYGASASVLLGNGDGTFQPARNYAGAGSFVGDFNGDGSLDLVVDAGLLSGNGHDAGAFPSRSGTVAAGDFNGDGLSDVAETSLLDSDSSSTVSVLLNDGIWKGPPTPQPPSLRINDVTIREGDTGTAAATFTVTLSAASTQPVTVAYATANGTATVGSDYQAASGTLTFALGETSKTVSVLVNGDRLAEPNETFVVNLSGPTNATIADGQGVGTILDDEPRISISDVSKKEGKKNQTTQFTFTVTLSAAYDQPVSVSFRTSDGTAKTSDQDYVATTGTITFKPGETTKTITITVNGDSKREADETFYLDLFGNSSNSLFTKNRGTGTILNDD
jgi:hypothetical protein